MRSGLATIRARAGASKAHERTVGGILVDVCLVMSALALAVVLVKREFFEQRVQGTALAPSVPTFVRRLEVSSGHGHIFGPNNAVVKVIVFDDLECPFCAQFHRTLRAIRARFPLDLSVEFVHFPLANHRFARPAAIAVECAGLQGKLEGAIDEVFARQDSLGLVSWAKIAAAAGIGDTVAFDRCRRDTLARFPIIDSGQAVGRSVGVTFTPSIFINGWKAGAPPDEKEFERIVERVKVGKVPFVSN